MSTSSPRLYPLSSATRRRLTFLSIAAYLAITIAATALVLAFMLAIVLRPLPFSQPRELRVVLAITKADISGLSKGWCDAMQSRRIPLSCFTSSAGTARARGDSAVVSIARVDRAFFGVVRPVGIRGRTMAEDQGAVVIGSRLARRLRVGIGDVIRLGETLHPVNGTAPEGLYPPGTDVWILDSGSSAAEQAATGSYTALTRSPEQELNSAWSSIRAGALRRASGADSLHLRSIPLMTVLRGESIGALKLALAAVLLAFLLACSNVAALLLLRSLSRERELAIRSALGATNTALAGALAKEAVLLAGTSACFAVLLSAAAVRLGWVVRILDVDLQDAGLALRWLIPAAVVLAFFAAAVAMLLPISHLRRVQLRNVLDESGTSVSAGRRDRRWRRAIVVAEIALTVVLLSVGSVLARAYQRVLQAPLGYDADKVLVTEAQTNVASGRLDATYAPAARRLADRLATSRAIEAATVWSTVSPPANIPPGDVLTVDGGEAPRNARRGLWRLHGVTGQFFRTFELRLVAGRDISVFDTEASSNVAVINEAAARAWWPRKSALGQRFRISGDGKNPSDWITVVGIVVNSQPVDRFGRVLAAEQPVGEVRPLVFLPLSGLARLVGLTNHCLGCSPLSIAVRPRAASWQEARRALEDQSRLLFPQVAFSPAATFAEDQVASQFSALRKSTRLLLSFSVIAIMLCLAGLVAVVQESVRNRRKEYAIRLAIGCTARSIVWLAASGGVTLTLYGGVLGIAIALSLNPILFPRIGGIATIGIQHSHSQPMVLIGSLVFLVAVSVSACLVPALRLLKLAPAAVLRGT